ncbi:MAG: hypothetical protein KatS3mg035_0976 [Bacteroidia bacterium]|nr:MAG: hypothetical protein KatS3mg035_0976 [Bacteroidia bacterium]
MNELSRYQDDGANFQAQAVLAFVRRHGGELQISYNRDERMYEAEPKVARWENCREQGYVISLRSKNYKRQLNIAFFEHRNSDSICAVKWEQTTLNSPTIDTAQFGDVYKDKYYTSFSVGYGEVLKMANWIVKQLEEFWTETSTN